MRVAVVTTSYPRSENDPSGHFVRTQARQLMMAGHEVVVFAPDGRSMHDGVDVIGSRSFKAFGWPGAMMRLRARPYRIAGAAFWMAHAREALRHAGPFDRVVAHWAVPSAWPIAERQPEVEVVSHGGDVRMLLSLPSSVRDRIVLSISQRATEWRFVSEELRVRLLGRLPGRLASAIDALSIIGPCAIDIPDVSARARELRGGRRTPIVCSVSRLVKTKRVDLVIAHAGRMGLPLVVIGGGPERERLEKIAVEHGVDARFLGTLPRDEALAWIAASDALLFASEAEGCSTVIREAEALGVRVERVA